MSNITILRGHCFAPFFEQSSFPSSGGCRLTPRPSRQDLSDLYRYPWTVLCRSGRRELLLAMSSQRLDLSRGSVQRSQDTQSACSHSTDFSNKTQSIGILNAIGLALVVFTLISFAILPKEKTRRHYLNVGLLLGIASLEVGGSEVGFCAN